MASHLDGFAPIDVAVSVFAKLFGKSDEQIEAEAAADAPKEEPTPAPSAYLKMDENSSYFDMLMVQVANSARFADTTLESAPKSFAEMLEFYHNGGERPTATRVGGIVKNAASVAYRDGGISLTGAASFLFTSGADLVNLSSSYMTGDNTSLFAKSIFSNLPLPAASIIVLLNVIFSIASRERALIVQFGDIARYPRKVVFYVFGMLGQLILGLTSMAFGHIYKVLCRSYQYLGNILQDDNKRRLESLISRVNENMSAEAATALMRDIHTFSLELQAKNMLQNMGILVRRPVNYISSSAYRGTVYKSIKAAHDAKISKIVDSTIRQYKGKVMQCSFDSYLAGLVIMPFRSAVTEFGKAMDNQPVPVVPHGNRDYLLMATANGSKAYDGLNELLRAFRGNRIAPIEIACLNRETTMRLQAVPPNDLSKIYTLDELLDSCTLDRDSFSSVYAKFINLSEKTFLLDTFRAIYEWKTGGGGMLRALRMGKLDKPEFIPVDLWENQFIVKTERDMRMFIKFVHDRISEDADDDVEIAVDYALNIFEFKVNMKGIHRLMAYNAAGMDKKSIQTRRFFKNFEVTNNSYT